MKKSLLLATACLSSLAEAPSSAKPVVLQSVIVWESTEGGEVKLQRIGPSNCRIDATHYGEGGKTTYRFEFGSRLRSAVKVEVDYEVPIYIRPDAKVVGVRRTTLRSANGRKALLESFDWHKSQFSPRDVASCSGP